MAIFNCKSCGGNLDIQDGTTVVTCEYCGRQQTVPSADNEKKVNLFNRANRLRSKCDFDKAASVYESIVAEFPTESEAYWGLCLCKFGIEYVDDPATANKIPTCHRTSYESIFDDSNFDLACENADALAVNVYRSEAKEIDRLQKEILEIAKNEKPFDVFICYKESDDMGGRTVDSELAHDIYDVLTEKGYKVFYSRITLKSKLGQDYEPYIFSALNSAKVMLSIGTKFEYFNAVWVKNEWSRFLALMKNDKSKMLIPCYRDIDPYDMPKEFSSLQGQDLSSPRAFQDLVTNIEKIIPRAAAPVQMIQNDERVTSPVDPLIKRAYMCLEDSDWNGADKCCEKVLDLNPESYDAYFVKFCIERKAHSINDIVNMGQQIDENSTNFQRAIRYGSESQRKQLKSINQMIADSILQKKQTAIYDASTAKMKNSVSEEDFLQTAQAFESIPGFKDADELVVKCREKAEEIHNLGIYNSAVKMKNDGDQCRSKYSYEEAEEAFRSISGFRDADELAEKCKEEAKKIENECKYGAASSIMRSAKTPEEYKDAEKRFLGIADFKDSRELAEQCHNAYQEKKEKAREETYNSAVKEIGYDTIDSIKIAVEKLTTIPDYKDSQALISKCEERLEQIKIISEKNEAAKALRNKKRNLIICVITAVVIVSTLVVLILVNNVFIPKGRYNDALELEKAGDYAKAIAIYKTTDYSDSVQRAEYCQEQIYLSKYKEAFELVKKGKYEDALNYKDKIGNYKEQICQDIYDIASSESDKYEAARIFNLLGDYSDSASMAEKCIYELAGQQEAEGNYMEAIDTYKSIIDYADSRSKISKIYYLFGEEKVKEKKYSEAVDLFNLMDFSKLENHDEILKRLLEVGDSFFEEGDYSTAIPFYKLVKNNGGTSEKYFACYDKMALQCYNNGDFENAFRYWKNAGQEGIATSEKKKQELYDKGVQFVGSYQADKALPLFEALANYNDAQEYCELCNTYISMVNGKLSLRDAKSKFTDIYEKGLDYSAMYINNPVFSELLQVMRHYEDQSARTTNAYVGRLIYGSTDETTEAFVISNDGLSLKYHKMSGDIRYGDSQWSSLFLSARNGTNIPVYLDGAKLFVKYDSTLNYEGAENGRLYLEFGYDDKSNTETLMVGNEKIPFYHYSFRHTQYNGGIPMDVPIGY